MKKIGIIIYTLIFIVSCSSSEINTWSSGSSSHLNKEKKDNKKDIEIKWEHKEEKPIKDADKEYKDPNKDHVFSKININSEYVDGKESKKIEDNISQFIYTPSTNDVYIYEANFGVKSLDIIKESQNKMGKFNIKEIIENKAYDPNIDENQFEKKRSILHARHVYFNFSNNDIASPYYSSKNDNTKTTVSGLYSVNGNSESLYNKVGIINMSFVYYTDRYDFFNKNEDYINHLLYNDKRKNYINRQFMSNLVFDEKYKNNQQLKVVSLGNSQEDKITPLHDIAPIYSTMSPEMQKMSRSEVIFTKSAISSDIFEEEKNKTYFEKEILPINKKIIYEVNGMKYYSQGFSDLRDIQVMNLRANTVAANPLIFIENDIYSILVNKCDSSEIDKQLCSSINQYDKGSSYAAPKVSRVAYEIKKKYPFLTYHQIKQVILTTAKRDKTGYLSNNVGWGILDYNKAINGPSNLNAGLIDEQKFFLGMPDRIFDKEGNRYFYVDIPNSKYTFSNDITTGLSGDVNSNEVEEFYVGKSKEKGQKLQIPKVLDSEKLFYRNYAKAGLRKDGKGTLILTGLQDYDTKTQVLGGKLILKNDSKSQYEVFSGTTLEIDKDNINILNGIKSNGIVDFKTPTNVSSYLSKGTTILHTGSVVNANSFKTDGNIRIEAKKISLKDLKNNKINLVNAKDISISNISNTFLKPSIKNNSLYVILDLDKKKLKDLSKSELRNIPSYNINKNKFFASFDKLVENEKPIALSVASNIINFKNDEEKVFSPIYNDYVSSIFEIKDDISSNVELNDMLNMTKNNKASFRALLSNNIFESDKYNKFSSNTNGMYLDYSRKLSNFIINPYLAYYYSKYNFKDDTDIDSKNYKLGLKLNLHLNKAIISNNLGFSIIDTRLKRSLDEIINIKNTSYLLSNKIKLAYDFEFDKFNLKPFITYNMDVLKLSDIKEESKFGLNLTNNNLIKHSLDVGANLKYNAGNDFNLNMGILYREYLNNDVKLNVNLLGLDDNITFVGRDILKRNLKFNFGFEKELIKDLIFQINNEFDTNKKYRLNLEMNYNF